MNGSRGSRARHAERHSISSTWQDRREGVRHRRWRVAESDAVRPWEVLGETQTPDGSAMALTRRDTEYVILANGKSLMSSLMHGSEEALGTLACPRLRAIEAPSVLIGGLGMGFTLRATLDLLP